MGEKNVLTISGYYKNVKKACQFVASGAKAAGMPEHAIFHIELACDEACTNIIEHAYGGEGMGEIRIHWELKNGRFVFTLSDDGEPFDPTAAPKPPPPTNVDDLKIGGLGIHFMRKLMDEVNYSYDKTDGNQLTLIKKQESGA